jgi:hypothetical protein
MGYHGRSYTVNLNGAVISTAITWLEVTAASNRLLQLIEAWLTQEVSETSQQEALQLIRKSVAGTGTAFTPIPDEPNQAAAGFTARVQCSGEGTVSDLIGPRQGFNALAGWFYAPLPESRILVPPSGILGIRFPVAPVSATWSGGAIFREIG